MTERSESSSSAGLHLSAPHTRALAARLKTVEDFCGEVERLMDAGGHIYSEYQGEIAPEEKRRIRAIFAELYGRLRDLRQRLGLPVQPVDRFNAINAYLSEVWVCLAETKSRHLKAYGPVPKELAGILDPRLDEIDAQVRELREMIALLKARQGSAISERAGPDPQAPAGQRTHSSRKIR
jgi:hypothetical protein